MKITSVIALVALCSGTAIAAGPFDQLRGKMKAGMYEYKMEMDMSSMPGMPPGMKNQTTTFQHCVTNDDIDKGSFGRNPRDGAKREDDCQVKNMNVSGSTASYTMICTKPSEMSADTKMTFTGDGYKMDTVMAMKHGGGPAMNMKQHMEARYLGPCK